MAFAGFKKRCMRVDLALLCHDELLTRLKLVAGEIIERLELLNGESLKLSGDVPKRIAILNRVGFRVRYRKCCNGFLMLTYYSGSVRGRLLEPDV